MKENNENSSSDPSLETSSDDSSKFHLPKWAKLAAPIGLVALIAFAFAMNKFISGDSTETFTAAELDLEEMAKRPPVQNFILTDAKGEQKQLSDYRGNVVILSFWASWCAPCLVELPTFADLEKRFGDKGLRILPVNVDEGNEGQTFAADFWKKGQFPFPSFFDTNKALAQQFEIEMLPSNFVIDKQGRLAFSSFGSNDWGNEETVEFLANLLAEPNEDPSE